VRRRSLTLAIATASAIALVAVVVQFGHTSADVASCGPGFVAKGARCLAPATACPAPLTLGPRGCDAPDVRVRVDDTRMTIGPSDWEAEGRVTPRIAQVNAFYIDAFEVTEAKLAAHAVPDGARAASGVALDEATRFCATQRGRLPTEDEWLAAAAGAPGRRYPWGDTGAVCRRAAWGLATGPCARSGTGPDTVGAHPDGATATGIHDLAGNVSEWVTTQRVTTPPGAQATSPGAQATSGAVRGGSWKTEIATGLRTWQPMEIDATAHDPSVGFRCAYATPD
jgi:formylglycine-generating enzyme